MPRKPAPIMFTPITSIEALDTVLEEMRNQGFFGDLGDDEENKYSEELIAEARQKVLSGASELWFSNSVNELKILNGVNGVNIYNFLHSNSDSIRAVQDAAMRETKSD